MVPDFRTRISHLVSRSLTSTTDTTSDLHNHIMTLSVSQTACQRWQGNGICVGMDVERSGFRLMDVLSWHLPGRAGKTHEKSQNSRRCSLYSNRTPPKYKSRTLPVHHPARCMLRWPRGASFYGLPFACSLPSLHYGCRSRGELSLDPLRKVYRENRWVYTAEWGTFRPSFLSFFLSFLVWPLLPINRSCWGLLLDLIAFNDIHTVGKTSLDEGSARRRDLYLITHNTQKIFRAKNNSCQCLSLTVRRAMSVTKVSRVAQTEGLQFEFRSTYACYGCLSTIVCYPVRIRACNDLITHPDLPDACKTMNEDASIWFSTLIPRTVIPNVMFFFLLPRIFYLCHLTYMHAQPDIAS